MNIISKYEHITALAQGHVVCTFQIVFSAKARKVPILFKLVLFSLSTVSAKV